MMTLYFEPQVMVTILQKDFYNKENFFRLLAQNQIFWLIEPTQEEQEKFSESIYKMNFDIRVITEILPSISTHQLDVNHHKHSIFFLTKTHSECKKLRDKYGLLFISMEKVWETIPYFFSHDLKNVSKKSDWKSVFEDYIHPCNAMLIVDKYFYKNSIKKTENSKVILADNFFIKEILPSLTHQNRTNKFHLTIISEENIYNTISHKEGFRDALENILDNANFSFEIVFRNDLHDRFIITNYSLLISGHGFSLKDTYFVYYPLTYVHDFKSLNNRENDKHSKQIMTRLPILYNNTIEKIKKICKEVKEGEHRINNEPFTNRLLS